MRAALIIDHVAGMSRMMKEGHEFGGGEVGEDHGEEYEYGDGEEDEDNVEDVIGEVAVDEPDTSVIVDDVGGCLEEKGEDKNEGVVERRVLMKTKMVMERKKSRILARRGLGGE